MGREADVIRRARGATALASATIARLSWVELLGRRERASRTDVSGHTM